MSEDRFAASAREYVESLHQNSRTHLLYGKNNVLVQPVPLQNPPPHYHLICHHTCPSLSRRNENLTAPTRLPLFPLLW